MPEIVRPIVPTEGMADTLDRGEGTFSLAQVIATWQSEHHVAFGVEIGEHGYPVVDLRTLEANMALGFLTTLDAVVCPAYHGMHNSTLRRETGLPEVGIWGCLDPQFSHQPPERKAVYATTSLKGGLVHALLEARPEDIHPVSGETYSLQLLPEPGGSFVEVSPPLAAALRNGEQRFTDGLLYVLPADRFSPHPASSHEVISKEKVTPLAVIRVGKTLGAEIITPLAMEIGVDDAMLEEAWQYYWPIGSDEYEQANEQRAEARQIMSAILGSPEHAVTLIGSIRIDPEMGKAIFGHEYRPEAASMVDTEHAFARYVRDTPPEQRAAIYEGDRRRYAERDEAIRQATDSGLIQYLAEREAVELVRGELTTFREQADMEHAGVSREEFFALCVARGLRAHVAGNGSEYMAAYLHYQAETVGLPGFHKYTDEEMHGDQRAAIEAEIEEQASQLLPGLQELYRPCLDNQELFVTAHGQLTVNPTFNLSDVETIVTERLSWKGSARLNEVAKINMEVRDKGLFRNIIIVYLNGKSPFVVYGGSHMVTLEPAVRAYIALAG
jgi:hypothetical protein